MFVRWGFGLICFRSPGDVFAHEQSDRETVLVTVEILAAASETSFFLCGRDAFRLPNLVSHAWNSAHLHFTFVPRTSRVTCPLSPATPGFGGAYCSHVESDNTATIFLVPAAAASSV